jgi:hypothetical protein
MTLPAMSINISNNHTYIGVDYLTCSLSKVWFIHSNSSLEFSAGIGVLSMAKQEMLRISEGSGKGEPILGSGQRCKLTSRNQMLFSLSAFCTRCSVLYVFTIKSYYPRLGLMQSSHYKKIKNKISYY